MLRAGFPRQGRSGALPGDTDKHPGPALPGKLAYLWMAGTAAIKAYEKYIRHHQPPPSRCFMALNDGAHRLGFVGQCGGHEQAEQDEILRPPLPGFSAKLDLSSVTDPTLRT